MTIADGVALKATHAGAANNTSCGSISATGTVGPPTLALTGVLIKCLGAIDIGGNVNALMTPGALANATYTAGLPGGFSSLLAVGGAAQLTIQGGIVDGNNLGSPAFGGSLIATSGTATLTLSGVTLRNRTATAISLAGSASVVLNNNSLIDSVGVAGNCPTGSATVITGLGSVTLDHSQISNGPSTGICVRNSTSGATIQITQGTIAHMGSGIASEVGFGSTAMVTMNGASFSNNINGVSWQGLAGTSFDIVGSSFGGNGTGISISGSGGSLKLRNSTASSNTGAGVSLSGGVVVDLGTQADAGGNTFTGNSLTGLQINLSSVGRCRRSATRGTRTFRAQTTAATTARRFKRPGRPAARTTRSGMRAS